jgi:hypothetical protein
MPEQRKITAAIMKEWGPHKDLRARGAPHHRGRDMHKRHRPVTPSLEIHRLNATDYFLVSNHHASLSSDFLNLAVIVRMLEPLILAVGEWVFKQHAVTPPR